MHPVFVKKYELHPWCFGAVVASRFDAALRMRSIRGERAVKERRRKYVTSNLFRRSVVKDDVKSGDGKERKKSL